jgi:Ca-activated chloride channel family protein
MPSKLDLKATWSHDPLPANDQPSLAYLLIDIMYTGEAAPASRPGSAPLNMSLVLDTSGSMGGAKLQNLKKAVSSVIDHLSPQDTIAITLFDDEVHPLVPSTQVTDRKSLHDKIDAIKEAGGTAMSKGLLVGLDEAMRGRRPGAVSRIVLLTDGQTWGDADRCRELAIQAGKQGIPVTALGVGAEEDWSIELLDTIAMQSGGLSDYIAKPEEISKAFEAAVRSMQATEARNLRLTLNLAGGVSPRVVYRVAPVISRLWPPSDLAEKDATTGASPVPTLSLGDMAESVQTLLFEVVLPERKAGQYRLAHLVLQYEMPGTPVQTEDAALDLVVGFATGDGEPGNPRVMNYVEKATTFKLQTRALQANQAGDVATATRNLRAVATRLLNMGETELAQAAEQEAENLEKNGRMSPAGTKKLAFDTRRLAVSETENTKAATVRFDD